MKKTPYLLFCLFILISCKKNSSLDPDGIRLVKIQYVNKPDYINSIFDYDAQGRITRISYFENNNPPETRYTIAYNGNEAIMQEIDATAGAGWNHQIKLTLDADGKPMKRIEYRFMEFFAPATNPQRTYEYDTAVYHYDAAGLLSKIDHTAWDTTWMTQSSILNTYSVRETGTTINTFANGNLSASEKILRQDHVVTQNSISVYSTVNQRINFTYFYTKQYPNKTDFANAAILNEYNLIFNYSINKNYKNLPERIAISEQRTDQNGTITYTSNSPGAVMNMNFNSYGFLESINTDPDPNRKSVFYYDR
jgi:hypothetical protein